MERWVSSDLLHFKVQLILTLEYLPEESYQAWDDFVDESPQQTIYGKTWYLLALQCPFTILTVKQREEIIGGIILTKNSRNQYANPLLVKYLGVYFTRFEGTAYNQESKRRAIIKLLMVELRKLTSFDYFFHPSFSSYLPFHSYFDNRVRYSYWINLHNQSLEEIYGGFHGKLKSELRLAEKEGYHLKHALDFELFFSIIKKTFVQKGHRFPFIKESLASYFQKLSEREAFQTIGVIDQKGNTMAVVGLLFEPSVTTLILSGFDQETIQRGANELLIYECLKLAKLQSQYFDFEGSMRPNVESFYRKFGGTFVPYLNIYKEDFGSLLKRVLGTVRK